ncbi:hypothetical protein [Methanolobus halotolerans]|uniref:Uncharacterized protein n=1 Tax=Methanolobus halotolerans TaxID=2052935 RepID=A0A4E0Q6Q3_9EURY|nr:hypothetical protein [Methanolobus halotolerans]TGC10567.1 hypothetical protein CUN85_03480 [Methanolobus halotolerans]
MPLDFVYQLNDFDTLKVLTKGEFTAAYVTISNEYYDGPEITEVSTVESPPNASSSPATPAFSVLCAVFAIASIVVLRKRHE